MPQVDQVTFLPIIFWISITYNFFFLILLLTSFLQLTNFAQTEVKNNEFFTLCSQLLKKLIFRKQNAKNSAILFFKTNLLNNAILVNNLKIFVLFLKKKKAIFFTKKIYKIIQ